MIDYSKRDVNDVFVILVAHVLFTSYLHVVFNNYVKDFGETCFSCNGKVKFCDAGVGQIDQNWHGNA